MLPSAAELEYFLEVCNTLNLSRASERLGISQPSLSLAIQRLEKSIGTTLLIRHKTGVSLTQPGKQLLLHARQLYDYWEDTKSKAIASETEAQGRFSIGCHSSIAMHVLSHAFANLLSTYPNLELHLKHDLSRKIVENVVNLSVDIGVVVNPIKHPDLIMHKICNDKVGFWKSLTHSSIQDIYTENAVILCDPNLIQTQTLLKQARPLGLISKRLITFNSLEVVTHFTAHGCGIGILPERVAKFMYPLQLEAIEDLPVYSDEIYIIYRQENRHLKAIQTISHFIRKHALSESDSYNVPPTKSEI